MKISGEIATTDSGVIYLTVSNRIIFLSCNQKAIGFVSLRPSEIKKIQPKIIVLLRISQH